MTKKVPAWLEPGAGLEQEGTELSVPWPALSLGLDSCWAESPWLCWSQAGAALGLAERSPAELSRTAPIPVHPSLQTLLLGIPCWQLRGFGALGSCRCGESWQRLQECQAQTQA